MLQTEVFYHVVHGFVGGLDGEIEAEGFEDDVFRVEDCVAPAPVVFCLFIDEFVGVFEGDADAGYDEFFEFAAGFFYLRCEE